MHDTTDQSQRILQERVDTLEGIVSSLRAELEDCRSSTTSADADAHEIGPRCRLLLAETHHRVKNNLQVVSALLELFAAEHKVAVPVEDVRQLSLHVRTLSNLHDLLTSSAQTTGDLGLVSVKDVLTRLVETLRPTVDNHSIRAKLDDAFVPLRYASALTIATNELVANSVKHGAGEIEVEFKVEGSTGMLSICDDGPGFPEGFDPLAEAHVGMELVLTVATWDLQGRVRFENHPKGGARTVVTFALPAVA